MARNRAPWLRHLPTPNNRRIYRSVAAIETLIRRNAERRRTRGSADRADLLDMVLQYRRSSTGARLSDAEVRDQLFTAIIAAPENIATTLSWIAYTLQAQPAILRTLRRAIERGDDEYLGAVIDESMRRHAATPMIDRTAARDVRLGGVDVPHQSLVIVPILALHNHPRYWDSPEAFRPERWLGRPAPRAFFPFGHGPRKCIGERLARAVIEAALRRFVMQFDWARPTPAEPLVNLRPRDRMRMSITRRGCPAQGHAMAGTREQHDRGPQALTAATTAAGAAADGDRGPVHVPLAGHAGGAAQRQPRGACSGGREPEARG